MSTAKSTNPAITGFGTYTASFLAGLVTMSLEMVVGRSFTPYFGGTLFTWGALISVFLLGMAVGYAFGGRLADAFPGRRSLIVIFLSASVPIGIFPLIGEPLINAVLEAVPDVRYAALLAAFALSFLPVAILAATSPFCVRLTLRSTRSAGTLSGRLSAVNTVGCIVGTLGTSFYLIPGLGVRAIFYLLASVCGLAALAAMASGTRAGGPLTAEEPT